MWLRIVHNPWSRFPIHHKIVPKLIERQQQNDIHVLKQMTHVLVSKQCPSMFVNRKMMRSYDLLINLTCYDQPWKCQFLAHDGIRSDRTKN